MNLNDKIFTIFYNRVNESVESRLVKFRRMTAGCATGHVLEIGPGTGANLSFYPSKSKVTVLEKNEFLFSKLNDVVHKTGLTVNLVKGDSFCMPFLDNSFDSIVTTLVLCMVEDLQSTIIEIKRVLKHGGTFYFYEHVKSRNSLRNKLENYMNPCWKYLTNGCNLNRDLERVLSDSGFTQFYVENHNLSVGLPIKIPNIVGRATL